jgi:GTP cyclohydrolase IA
MYYNIGMTDRMKITKLPTANGNMPLTDIEKQEVIRDATIAYEKFLDALRIDWRNDPNSDNTPHRVAKAYVYDLASGCYNELPNITSFPSDGYDGIIFQGGIPVKSLCSHHHLAFSGVAHVAYIPSKDGKVIGLSKLNRIVEHFARRPQIQESLVSQVAEAINNICEGNKGVAVLISAQHTCACNRGVRHDGCEMKTSKLFGDFLKEPETRKEFYDFVNQWYINRR